MVERSSGFFFIEESIIDNNLAVRLEGLFEQGIKWDATLGLETQTMVERPSVFVFFPLKLLGVRLEGLFEQRIKWDVPLGLDFGLGLWRLHTMLSRRLHSLYFIGYFQPISLDSQQQSFATQSHGLSTWTAIV